ncbi:hypothetical protein [Vulcanococcus limneticus]|uniref:hypothetical protein n=1 Tax=Vulcanococcus limneticus TaxID=2170428 RepID=UPI00398BCAB8
MTHHAPDPKPVATPASARARSPMPWRVTALALLTPLLGGCDTLWRWTAQPFRLSCGLGSDPPTLFRIEPRLQQVQELDPKTGEVTRTITTSEPPAELGGGIIDDSKVTITPRRITWESSMYRPQLQRDSHAIDLSTLHYASAWTLQLDAGPEMAEGKRTGRCRRIEGQA